jgi:hypothetical protein
MYGTGVRVPVEGHAFPTSGSRAESELRIERSPLRLRVLVDHFCSRDTNLAEDEDEREH